MTTAFTCRIYRIAAVAHCQPVGKRLLSDHDNRRNKNRNRNHQNYNKVQKYRKEAISKLKKAAQRRDRSYWRNHWGNNWNDQEHGISITSTIGS